MGGREIRGGREASMWLNYGEKIERERERERDQGSELVISIRVRRTSKCKMFYQNFKAQNILHKFALG